MLIEFFDHACHFRSSPVNFRCISGVYWSYLFFESALKQYLIDITLNPSRFDSWASVALCKAADIDDKLRSFDDSESRLDDRKLQSAIFAFDKAISLEKNGKILIEFAQLLFTLANRIPETANMDKNKVSEKANDKLLETSDKLNESDKKVVKTDFEMLEKSEALFDQVKESMPEEEWLVLYMKGRASRTRKH